MRHHVAIALLAACACAAGACAPGSTTIGSVTLKVPDGWRVSDREGTNLKLTDGSIAGPESTRAGTATAVFDIYVESSQTVDTFLAYLKDQRIQPERSEKRIDGYDAVILTYSGRSVGGRQEAVLIPERKVFILYRAAFRNDDAAFLRGHAAFLEAVGSISFASTSSSSSRGGASASGVVRHGPMFGKSARTANDAPIAIIAKAS